MAHPLQPVCMCVYQLCMIIVQNHLEEAHKQHAFKQAQSSKLVKENENMMDHLLKERLSTEEAQELTVSSVDNKYKICVY